VLKFTVTFLRWVKRNGKPYAVARIADLPLTVDVLRYMGGWATKVTGTTIPEE
jgi:hypothetical protein